MNHCKTIAIVNQKGGVGKTTSTVNLGVGLAQAGNRVLLVDDDPQHSLTISLGIRNADDDLDTTLATAMQAEIRDESSFSALWSARFIRPRPLNAQREII